MAKTTKPKAMRSPKKPHIEPSKKTGRARRKTAISTANEAEWSGACDDELEDPATDTLTLKIPARVVWDKYPERTERLLDYLDTHPDIAIKLFGDSTQTAKSEGCSKLTAKSNKAAAYLQVADGIFSIDDDAAIRANFATNPNKYAKAVDNYITNSLKKQYRAVNERIGRTGAGLKVEDVTPGSEIANIIEKETENFKWWLRLHGFWRTLPNFNPYTVSSDPGQDLADEALSVLMGGHEKSDLGLDEGNLYSMCATPDGDDDTPSASSTFVTPFTPLSSTPSSSKASSEATSKTPSRASTPKSRTLLKRTLQDAFAEGSARQSEILERLGTQKHERAIGELELKRRKLENKAIEKQHQREHEHEQHEFRMLQMRLMMSQNQQTAPMMVQPQPQPQPQQLYNEFGFMADLNGAALPSGSSLN